MLTRAPPLPPKPPERDAGDYDMESISKHSLTYEHLRRLVERALTQAGYYDLPQPKTESTVA